MSTLFQWLRRFFCHHRYEVIQRFKYVRGMRVHCNKCGGDWAYLPGEEYFLPWDEEFEQFYKSVDSDVEKMLERCK